jgi:glycosyltransferase involved in cell wall biosynthesis
MAVSGQFIILTPGFAEDERDTTCLPSLQQFVLALHQAYPSLKVIVIAFQYPFRPRAYAWHGITVFALGGASRPRWHRLLTWAKALCKLRRLRQEGDIAGVFSLWLGECALLGRYFSNANRIRHYTWVMGQDARPDNHYVRRVKPDGTRVIAMSDFLKRELERNFGLSACCVANNGISEEAFPELNTGQRPYDLVGAGSLVPLKNYSVFIEVVHELKTRHPRIIAAIAGEGPERDRLQAQIESRGLSANVTLLGKLPHPETLRLMNQARVFLHPSQYEGNSTVLLEALCAGCQAVSFCRLADAAVENLWICKDQADMVATVASLLAAPAGPAKRVVFNRMADTVRKIIDLYDRRRTSANEPG